MRRINYWLASFVVGSLLVFSSCSDDDPMDPPMMEDDSFYATMLGGTTLVPDPDNPGQQIQQGFLNLRTVVTNTVLTIATNEGGVYDDLLPYFSVLLNEVARDDFSGFAQLVDDFTIFLAEATGGPFTYTGLDMEAAHDPQRNPRMDGLINNADYDLFIQAVVEGAAQAGITSSDVIGPVGELLESVREPIVQRADDEMLDLYTRLGGSGLIDDPENPGQLIEAGFVPLRAVVTETVLLIASNPEGKYTDLLPYFSVLLAEVGAGDTSGFATLVQDFSEFLAEAIGSVNIQYTGLDMVAAHDPEQNPRMTGLVNAADYDLFVAAIVEAAKGLEVPESVIGEFGGLLNSPGLRDAVIQR
ncbi:hypothetical protein A3SI_08666 [Nitritalea halalkaliphila LW7]|uniref:Group 1 truncated hemoglobin n=1 Tax=Nitritalea halalkaliphila LW7 TaxID=1189621 RepID=I5C4M2_9BACT|nr:hypothetical protein [Nitritalea halalkaliphila]EIM76774.1 hypothetical protein A3SI_08666 [Nitritalea halalkaliphila LW7]